MRNLLIRVFVAAVKHLLAKLFGMTGNFSKTQKFVVPTQAGTLIRCIINNLTRLGFPSAWERRGVYEFLFATQLHLGHFWLCASAKIELHESPK
jgi:hypothetical protein